MCIRDSGITATFTSFGLGVPCIERPLQAATITGRDWIVRVGKRRYRVGRPRTVLPRGSRYFRDFGFHLASMPFIGTRTPTVGAQLGGKQRIFAFNLFIGAA